MKDKNTLLRAVPKMDILLDHPEIKPFILEIGHDAVLDICRATLLLAKQTAEEDGSLPPIDAIVAEITAGLHRKRALLLGRVVNGTGILLHTNLGRAPLGNALFADMAQTASGYCNLEIDVAERKRGVRGEGVAALLCRACNAEAAAVVNNNAAALFLTLFALAHNLEVIVSRGELVQIGGGFRIPDILKQAGARLVEVGTTNITTVEDYQNALGDNTAMILSVHRANFAMSGFVEFPTIAELRETLGPDIPIVADLGSGNFVRKLGTLHIQEPTPKDALSEGADLVCFSCDKMLGAAQGGVIAGKRALVERVKKHPIMRVVRPGKLTYAALQSVLSHHLSGNLDRIPLWKCASTSVEELAARVDRFLLDHGLPLSQFVPCKMEGAFGGGSSPEAPIPSFGMKILVPSADDIAREFQSFSPPIVGRVVERHFAIDFRTLLDTDEQLLAEACRALVNRTNA